ncbi:hypothetical protein STENM327S_02296 [Streptomyces tendae]
MVREDGRLLAIRRADNGTWELPGGVLELNETPEVGVAREVLEETGIHVEVDELTGVYKNTTRGIVALVFRCKPSGGTERTSSESTGPWSGVTPDEVSERMTRGLPRSGSWTPWTATAPTYGATTASASSQRDKTCTLLHQAPAALRSARRARSLLRCGAPLLPPARSARAAPTRAHRWIGPVAMSRAEYIAHLAVKTMPPAGDRPAPGWRGHHRRPRARSGVRGELPIPSTVAPGRAEQTRPPGRQGRSYSGALHLDAPEPRPLHGVWVDGGRDGSWGKWWFRCFSLCSAVLHDSDLVALGFTLSEGDGLSGPAVPAAKQAPNEPAVSVPSGMLLAHDARQRRG